jgi:hypothetical protein
MDQPEAEPIDLQPIVIERADEANQAAG